MEYFKGLTPLEFAERHLIPNEPAVFRALAANWPASVRWTAEYFEGRSYSDELCMRLQDERLNESPISLRAAAKLLKEGQFNDRYIAGWQFGMLEPRLAADYQVPNFLGENWGPELASFGFADLRWIILGVKGSRSLPHIDIWDTSAWLALITGMKLVTMERPIGTVARQRTPDVIEVEIRAGDVIFIPGTWRHSVLNVTPTISVTENFLNLWNVRRSLILKPPWREGIGSVLTKRGEIYLQAWSCRNRLAVVDRVLLTKIILEIFEVSRTHSANAPLDGGLMARLNVAYEEALKQRELSQ